MTALSTTTAYAFKTGTIGSTAVVMKDIGGTGLGFSQAELNRADRARIGCATNAIRYRYDGGVPTATVGHFLAANGETVIEGGTNISNLQFIRVGSDGVVSITLEEF